MLENVKAQIDAVLAHNEIDVMNSSALDPVGSPRLSWLNPPVQDQASWGALHPKSEM